MGPGTLTVCSWRLRSMTLALSHSKSGEQCLYVGRTKQHRQTKIDNLQNIISMLMNIIE